MKIYVDGCSWTAGFGLSEGNSLADFISREDRTITVYDFSYSGKSNSSMLDDLIDNRRLVDEVDWVVVGLTTPYRYNIYSQNNQRIDFAPAGITVVLDDQKNHTFVDENIALDIEQYQKCLYSVNLEKYHILSTIKNYFALKNIAGTKFRCFSVHQHLDPLFDKCFNFQQLSDRKKPFRLRPDENGWIHNWKYFPILDDGFQEDNGHLNMTGMQRLAKMVLQNVYG